MAKLVFITGASSGIGQALALQFFQAGYRLALVARREEVVKSWASQHGITAECYQIYSADVAEPAQIMTAGERCLAEQGVPDVVLACAGISIGMDTRFASDIAVMARTFAINNTGMAATFQPFVQKMSERGHGVLVGVASVAAIRGLPGHGAYCASKAGVVAYCESLRGELRASGVKVVTLVPGYVDTPLTQVNRYSMPFLMQPEHFAARAFKAIEAGASYSVIPWQMGVAAKLLRLLPNPIYDRLLQGRGRKPRIDSA